MKKIIILLGVPGSGKGTQAKLLITATNYGHISTGDLLRALAKDENADPKDKQMLEEMKAGKLVPSELVYRLTFAEIKKHLTNGNGVIVDGAIRKPEQAKAFQEFFIKEGLETEVVAIEVAITDDESLKRSLTRRKYADMGQIVPAVANSGDGKNAVVEPPRADDDPEVLKKRLEEMGNTALKPILEYYRGLSILKTIDGTQTIDNIYNDISEYLKELQ